MTPDQITGYVQVISTHWGNFKSNLEQNAYGISFWFIYKFG